MASRNQIFFAHSKDDRELLDELAIPFAHTDISQFQAGFEDIEEPVSESIKEQIQNSRALFVILGENAQEKQHTKIWIAWEVGIAIQNQIDVWVLNDINWPIRMPIPSITDYLLWDREDEDQKRDLRDMLENEFVDGDMSPPRKLGLDTTENPTFGNNRNRRVRGQTELLIKKPIEVECPYEGCGEQFRLRFEGVEQFNCPACRRGLRPAR